MKKSLELSIFHLLMMIFGISICCLGLYEWRKQECFAKFIPVQATIISSTTQYTQFRGLYGSCTEVIFEYRTPNGTIKHNEIDFLPAFFPNPLLNDCSRNVCCRLLYLYPEWGDFNHWDKYWLPGRAFTLYINPSNPNEWSWEHGPNRETYLTLGIGFVLMIIFCGIVYLKSMLLLKSSV